MPWRASLGENTCFGCGEAYGGDASSHRAGPALRTPAGSGLEGWPLRGADKVHSVGALYLRGEKASKGAGTRPSCFSWSPLRTLNSWGKNLLT